MVVFRYLCFIFRNFPLTCISERLNRYLSNLFMIRMKTRSCRFVKVTDNIRRGGIAVENERSLLQISCMGDMNTCNSVNMLYLLRKEGSLAMKEHGALWRPAASLLLSGCLISPEAGDRKIWVMVLAVGSRLSPSRLAGQETTTKGCVGV